jgi:protein TonB
MRPLLRYLIIRNFQLALLCFVCVAKTYGQTIAKNYYGRIEVEFTKEKRPKKFYTKVQIKTSFPGGDSAWVKYIEKNINQSIGLGKGIKKGKYIVSVKFILSKDGNLSDITCEYDPGFGMCEEVIRVLKKTKEWVPAEQGGKAVREYRKG